MDWTISLFAIRILDVISGTYFETLLDVQDQAWNIMGQPFCDGTVR